MPQHRQKSLYASNPSTLIVYVTGDHVARKLSFVCKKDRNPASPIILQKDNTLNGGSDAEVLAEYLEDTLPYKTRITIFFLANDTNTTVWNVLQFDLTSINADDPLDIETLVTGRIVREQNVSVTPVGGEYSKPELTLTKYAHWEYEEGVDAQPIVKAMKGWTNNPVATVSGDIITIASAGAEIPDATDFDSTFKDYDTGTWDSSTRVMYFGDLTGKTIEFWLAYYE